MIHSESVEFKNIDKLVIARCIELVARYKSNVIQHDRRRP